MGYLGNLGGYKNAIPSDYFWSQRAPGQVVRPSWVDYTDSRYLVSPVYQSRSRAFPYDNGMFCFCSPDKLLFGSSSGEITLYKDKGFSGAMNTYTSSVSNLKDSGFNDAMTSFKVKSGIWILYPDANYIGSGEKVAYGPFGPGNYDMGAKDATGATIPNDRISSMLLYNDNNYVKSTDWTQVLNIVVSHFKSHAGLKTTDTLSPCVMSLLNEYVGYMKSGQFSKFGLYNYNCNIYEAITKRGPNANMTSHFAEIISGYVNTLAKYKCGEIIVVGSVGQDMDQTSTDIRVLTGDTNVDTRKTMDQQSQNVQTTYPDPQSVLNSINHGKNTQSSNTNPQVETTIGQLSAKMGMNPTLLYIGAGMLGIGTLVLIMIPILIAIKRKRKED